jgi:hypothetical protein
MERVEVYTHTFLTLALASFMLQPLYPGEGALSTHFSNLFVKQNLYSAFGLMVVPNESLELHK